MAYYALFLRTEACSRVCILLALSAHVSIDDNRYVDVVTELGYAQGMNDILARFLVVTDSEVDSYWMFCNFMEKKRTDFLEDTMMCKISKSN